MKNWIMLLMILTILLGCEKSKSVEKSNKSSKTKAYNKSKKYVEYYAEKVSLLAIIKGVESKKLQSILIDYYTTIYESDGNVTITENDNTISEISKKYNLSKSTIATLIYNFEYEMLTKDEIYEIETDRYNAEQEQEMQENY